MRVLALLSLLTVGCFVSPGAAQQKPAQPSTTKPAPKEPGTLVGVLVGGSAISQQAETFSQADPFLGCLVRYRS